MEHVLDICFPEMMQVTWISMVFFPTSSGYSVPLVDGESARSRSVLATSRAPPTLVEGRVPSASQRRTVLSDMPVSRAMSGARRYSVPPVMTGSPNEDEVAWGDWLAAAEPIGARLAARARAPNPSAKLNWGRRFSGFLNQCVSSSPGGGNPGDDLRNGANDSIFDGARQFDYRGRGRARTRASV
jgi:hypothetical protein